jgi:hypothetical protein
LAVTPVSFEDAWKIIDGSRNKHLLLGNGFSIALKPNIFSYGSLFENADFSSAPHVKALFDALGTQDFEIAIRHLKDAETVVNIYRPDLSEPLQKFEKDADLIKDALVSAIAKRHPDRPHDMMFCSTGPLCRTKSLITGQKSSNTRGRKPIKQL